MSASQGERMGTIRGVRLSGARRADPFGNDPVDVFLDGDVVADIAPTGAVPARGAVLNGEGAWIMPGLWDHHVHTVQWALASARTSVAHAESWAQAAAIMRTAPTLGDGRRIGTGFRDGAWPDEPSLALLDAATGTIPTYLINADIHSVWLNSAALRREGHPVSGSGVLREHPAFEISRRLNAADSKVADASVAAAADAAAARGVVGIVDFDMAWNEEAWTRRLAAGFDGLRVVFGVYPEHLDRALAEGLTTGAPVRGVSSDLVRVGALKVITDGSLGTRTAAVSRPYPGDGHDHGMLTVDRVELTDLLSRATAGGLACAVHAIGDVANSQALDVFAATGAWGSIEHAQLVAHADIPKFARLGVAASVQPEHAVDDRDLADAVWAGQTAAAYPLRALADAGARMLFGSDAPVAPLDPWVTLAAAVGRTRDGREPWHPEEIVPIRTALAASTEGGSVEDPVAVEPGAPSDLVLCEKDPLTTPADELRAMNVKATLLGGRLTFVD